MLAPLVKEVSGFTCERVCFRSLTNLLLACVLCWQTHLHAILVIDDATRSGRKQVSLSAPPSAGAGPPTGLDQSVPSPSVVTSAAPPGSLGVESANLSKGAARNCYTVKDLV
jgi:hypothetical protein